MYLLFPAKSIKKVFEYWNNVRNHGYNNDVPPRINNNLKAPHFSRGASFYAGILASFAEDSRISGGHSVEITLSANSVAIAKELAKQYATFESSIKTIDIPDSIKAIEYNFLAILGEMACSKHLTGDVSDAVLNRIRGLNRKAEGLSFDLGYDLTHFDVDIKTSRNRKGYAHEDLHLLVAEKHLRPNRTYILAVLVEPLSLFDAQKIVIDLVGWSLGKNLERAINPDSFSGAYRLKGKQLQPMESLSKESVRIAA